MFQTILNPYDVFRGDIFLFDKTLLNDNDKMNFFSTDPSDYLSGDGFYI